MWGEVWGVEKCVGVGQVETCVGRHELGEIMSGVETCVCVGRLAWVGWRGSVWARGASVGAGSPPSPPPPRRPDPPPPPTERSRATPTLPPPQIQLAADEVRQLKAAQPKDKEAIGAARACGWREHQTPPHASGRKHHTREWMQTPHTRVDGCGDGCGRSKQRPAALLSTTLRPTQTNPQPQFQTPNPN